MENGNERKKLKKITQCTICWDDKAQRLEQKGVKKQKSGEYQEWVKTFAHQGEGQICIKGRHYTIVIQFYSSFIIVLDCLHSGPYEGSYPAPSFCNPIPWKPIHVPPPETSPKKTSGRKPQKKKKPQQSPSTAFNQRNTPSAAHFLYRR
uniref:Uncharacterized protein n=1 Tax=Fundulus heteroclitus TaxID=8078 RepID=A0A3Q2P995_FUNHE